MKKLMMLALLLFVVFQSQSQGFEGSVKWTMKMDITDPKLKAQMEAGQAQMQAQMNDPKMQAQMKEMKAKMEDPAFKAQLDANPALKAQMETMMKSMSGGAAPGGSMTPSGMTMKMKGGNTLTSMDGGMFAGMETLYLHDKNQAVKLDRKNKTYSLLPTTPSGKPGSTSTMSTPKFTKTSETTKILGYTCTKYIVEITEGKEKLTQFIWTTTDIKDIDFKALSSQRVSQSNHTMLPAGVEGIPLRIESSVPQGKMIMEVTEIKKESLPASDFTIPSDFKETKFGF
ncbi:MAG: DUF4412 domain-containing protein [Cyclobacteriaceae bacterium]|nr:DUF4412 domain-containing protein [Cyclobacteriaceae bacterium]